MKRMYCVCHSLLENEELEFQPSPFFNEQLTAFELWLEHGSSEKKPPEQLPIVLQVSLQPVTVLRICHAHHALHRGLLKTFCTPGAKATDNLHQQLQLMIPESWPSITNSSMCCF